MADQRKKIALLREDELSEFEMQIYAPLAKDFAITVLSPRRRRSSDEVANLPIFELPSSKNTLSGLRDPFRMMKRITNPRDSHNFFHPDLLRRQLPRFDVVHVSETHTCSAFTAAAMKTALGFRLVTTVGENIPYNVLHDPGALRRRAYVAPMVDRFIATTEQAKRVLHAEHLPAEKIEVILPGIDLTVFKPGMPDRDLGLKLGCQRGDFVLLFNGTFLFRNGILTLLESLKLLRTQSSPPPFRCIIIGDGREKKGVEKRIELFGLRDCVVLAGEVKYTELPFFYHLADVVVLPSIPEKSWQEPFNFAGLQAMACQRPIVATACGALPEIIGEGALYAVPASVQSLFDQLARLMADARLRQELAEKGYQRALVHFDARKQAERIKHLYLDVLSQKTAPISYKKKISVIIPVYNRAGIIGNALQSLRQQRGLRPEDIEIICIDDGSTDDLKQALAQFPEVRLIKIPHCGRAGLVRNEGLKVAQGEIIAYLDSDDRWKSDHLKTILREFEKDSRLGFVATRATYEVVEPMSDGTLRILQRGRYRHKGALVTDCIAHKKICSDQVGGFGGEAFAEDRVLWNRIMLNFPSKKIRKVTAVFRFIKKGNNLSYRFEHLKKKFYE